ncbi:Arginine--tRNA ligase [Limihaloglobus sulfuriphilus]|uniref:Arginine--tRNA ligase n=1 Tax=Limihaloglobus sulfuriphilus TaxID=1851148 RepID=A0A1Q2MBA0_9BACT|nr:arginine--tRNA ligase [Limihaloglobus sulfuriphilus]AQQ69808.1 Arginine--tRNA ligase [Limihaloglobus sulfuriphilus]
MKPTINILENRVSAALSRAAESEQPLEALLKPSTNPKFGDYQANGVMAAAKRAGQNPRELAAKVIEILDVSDICDEPEIAGPGFINFRLKKSYISSCLSQILNDRNGRLAVEPVENPQTVVVDYSGPNIAKEMHVGHLRSTILGDCICQILEFLGHKVLRQNHIGDWGTQFGMLCALLKRREKDSSGSNAEALGLSDLESFYKEAKKKFDSDPDFAAEARAAIAGLHSGDREWLGYWQEIVDESKKHYMQIYDMLSIGLKDSDARGESAYKDDLAAVVKELRDKGLAVESDGAVCVFPDGYKTKDSTPMPFIIQKSDGAFLYATTDLAAMKYRVSKLGAERIVYVTDARQKLHFEMLFDVAKSAGIAGEETELSHVTFGTMLGNDGKPFKTRSGDNVKLKDLLEEAVERAAKVVDEKNAGLEPQLKARIAAAVGIGAVKYSDYSNNRTTDYIFSFDKMLAMEGNTAPYMQYACARVKSIERKAAQKGFDTDKIIASIDKFHLEDDFELDLAKHLLTYSEAVSAASQDYRPNLLTGYLYELAQKFSGFYTNCPVLTASQESLASRLALCKLTEVTLEHGLKKILRIDVPEKM